MYKENATDWSARGVFFCSAEGEEDMIDDPKTLLFSNTDWEERVVGQRNKKDGDFGCLLSLPNDNEDESLSIPTIWGFPSLQKSSTRIEIIFW